jgi:hypothetical protein
VRRELEALIEFEGLPPGQQARLLRVHELLVAAGPPAELPGSLLEPPGRPRRRAGIVALAAPRRRATVLLAAAALAAL